MYEWGQLQETVNAWRVTEKITPAQRNRIEYFASIEAEKPVHGSLRQRAAAALLKVVVALDGEAQAAFAEMRVAHHH